MKYLVYCLLFFVTYVCSAENEYLIIRLQTGKTDTIKVSDIASIKLESSSLVNDNLNTLTKNFPNPFSESTTIEFELNKPENVDVQIYDNTGTLVKKLVCENCPTGKNSIKWDSKNQKGELVPNGIYFYEIRTSDQTLRKHIIKIK